MATLSLWRGLICFRLLSVIILLLSAQLSWQPRSWAASSSAVGQIQLKEKKLTDLLNQYHDTWETGYNRGPWIDSANRAAKAPLGSPYCASFVSMILTKLKAIFPVYRGAWARSFISSASVDAKLVFYGKAEAPPLSIAVFVRPGGGGHVGFFIKMISVGGKKLLKLFEANTSKPGMLGSQYDGKWTGWKFRTFKSALSPFNTFRIRAFTPYEAP